MAAIDVYDFGLLLKELRESKHLSQEEVANKIDVTRSSISAYELNHKAPSKDTLKSLAYLFNVSSDYLLGIDDRKAIYLDDYTQEQQDIIIEFLDKLKPQLKKAGN